MPKMSQLEKRLYFASLFTSLGLIALVNLVLGVKTSSIPYASISIQIGVIVAAAVRQPWSRYVVITWAGICIVGVLAMWLAFFLRGTFAYSSGIVIYKTVLLLACVYFALEAPSAFGAPDSQQRADAA